MDLEQHLAVAWLGDGRVAQSEGVDGAILHLTQSALDSETMSNPSRAHLRQTILLRY